MRLAQAPRRFAAPVAIIAVAGALVTVAPVSADAASRKPWHPRPRAVTAAQPARPSGAVREVLVKYRQGVSRAAAQAVRSQRQATLRQHLPYSGADVLAVPSGSTAGALSASLQRDPRVEFAMPNLPVHRLATDMLPSEWGLDNQGQPIPYFNDAIGGYDTANPTPGVPDVDIDAPQAWAAHGQGKRSVVVAITDSGVDINHPDLAPAVYTNRGEIPGNGKDDDGNDLVDDVHGWDFCHDDASVYDNPSEDEHGTHVAGTIAAANDGQGVVGVAPGVSILPVKFLGREDGADGCSDLAQAVDAIFYAVSQGARIINASWGLELDTVTDSRTITQLNDLIKELGEQYGVLLVAAAGNEGVDLDHAQFRNYPAALTAPNVLTVAAIGSRGQLMAESDYGRRSVDLAAPGMSILSTVPDNGTVPGYDDDYAWADGTSMAAPHVSGVAALLLSAHPRMTALQLAARIKASVKRDSALTSRTVTGGIVDAELALRPGTLMTTSLSRSSVSYGAKITVTGLLRDAVTYTPLPKQKIRLYAQLPGRTTWAYAGTFLTGSKGTAVVTRTMAATTRFQWRFAGTSAQPARDSVLSGVTVRALVTGTLSATTARRGQAVTLAGKVSPGLRAPRVWLQRKVGTTWRTLATAVPSAHGEYRFVVRPSSRGVWTLRVVRPSDGLRAVGSTSARTLRVS
jgi:subtilisin family serine protease